MVGNRNETIVRAAGGNCGSDCTLTIYETQETFTLIIPSNKLKVSVRYPSEFQSKGRRKNKTKQNKTLF